MRRFVVHLHCTSCDRHEEKPYTIHDMIRAFNADKECCGGFMEHINCRLECSAKGLGLVCTDCLLYPC